MESNRLVVTLNRKDNMSIGYEQGIQSVYLNSYLTKEFVVRPVSPLLTGETMWVTFYQKGATPLEAIMLTPRETTKANSTMQVVGDNLDSIEQSQQQQDEYYMQLPLAVLKNAGKWQFSLAIVVLYDNTTDSVQYDNVAHKYKSSDAYDLVEQADTIAQAATSDIAGFIVNNSLANVPGGAPNDKTIVAVYNGVIESAAAAAQSATDAANTAANVQETVDNAVEIVAQQATEQVTAATKQAIVDETKRATEAESELSQSIEAESQVRRAQAQELQGELDSIKEHIPTDASTFMTINTSQTVTGRKQFNAGLVVSGEGVEFDSSNGAALLQPNGEFTALPGIVKMPAKPGTLALLSDFENYITTSTAQKISGNKTFTGDVHIEVTKDASTDGSRGFIVYGNAYDDEVPLFQIQEFDGNPYQIDIDPCGEATIFIKGYAIEHYLKRQALNSVYPVGSIYMSYTNNSPASFLGGSWTQLQNRFLLGAGSSYTGGSTGGEATHTLTVSEMPSHNHTYTWGGGTGSQTGCSQGYGTTKGEYSTTVSSTGSGSAHNNMPPYLVVYMWRRTA